MSKEQQDVFICDQCGDRLVIDKKEHWIGGHPTHGWFHLTRVNASTMIDDWHKEKNKFDKNSWDFCGNICLQNFVSEWAYQVRGTKEPTNKSSINTDLNKTIQELIKKETAQRRD